MRRVGCVLALGLALGCGSKGGKDEGKAASAKTTEKAPAERPTPRPITDEELKALHKRVQDAKPAPASTRPGLPPVAKSGDARGAYEQAADVVTKNPTAAEHPHDPAALSVAELLAQGAAAPTSTSPLAAKGGDAAAYAKAGTVALAVAFAEVGAGKGGVAVRHGLVVARMASDVARDAGWTALEATLPLVTKAMALVRTALAAGGPKAKAADLTGLADACEAVRAGMPSLRGVAEAETRARDEKLVEHGSPTAEAVRPYEAARKALVEALKDGEGRVLAEKLEAAKATDVPDALLRADLAVSLAKAQADVAGTCLLVALESHKRAHGGVLPKTLEDAVGKGKVPAEPIGGGAWEYVDDGLGGRLLRSGAIMVAGKAESIELPIRGKATTKQR